MRPADCMDSNVEGAHRHIYSEVVKLRQLDVFLDPMVLFSRAPGVTGLSLKERVALCQIVKEAHEIKKKEEELEQLFEEMRKQFAPLLGSAAENEDLPRLRDEGTGNGLAENSWFF
jgi:hypothetical protein